MSTYAERATLASGVREVYGMFRELKDDKRGQYTCFFVDSVGLEL